MLMIGLYIRGSTNQLRLKDMKQNSCTFDLRIVYIGTRFYMRVIKYFDVKALEYEVDGVKYLYYFAEDYHYTSMGHLTSPIDITTRCNLKQLIILFKTSDEAKWVMDRCK